MKTTLSIISLLVSFAMYGQTIRPIKFDGKLYGYITNSKYESGGPLDSISEFVGGRVYKGGRVTFNISTIPMSNAQTLHLEDSLRKRVAKQKKDVYLVFKYSVVDKTDNILPQGTTESAGDYLVQSGRLRNSTLAFAFIGGLGSALVITYVNPIAGLIVAGVSGIIVIVEEARANNMLIDAGNTMLQK